MPFGLCYAPATFQWQVTVLYLDDIIVVGRDFEEHLNNLNIVINRLNEANLKLKAKKCFFSAKKCRSSDTLYHQKELKQTQLKLKQWMTGSVLQINLNYGVF